MIIDVSDYINVYKKNKLIERLDIENLKKVLSKYKHKKIYLLLKEELYKNIDKYIKLGKDLNIKRLIIKERSIIETINSNLSISDASGNLVINLYKDSTEISLIALNNVIKYDIYKYSYNELTKVVKDEIKKKLKYDLDIFTCELIYQELYINNRKYIEVEGHKIRSKKLTKVRIKKTDLNKVLVDYLSKLMKDVKKFLDNIYPVLKRDILDTGIIIYSNYLNQSLLDLVGNKNSINIFYIEDNTNMINTYKGIIN